MTTPAYDKQDQFEKIAAGLLHGEQIIAVYDAKGAGTGFIGVTNLRVVLQDNSFVGKKVALTSLPYNRISSVSFVSDKSMLGKFASSRARARLRSRWGPTRTRWSSVAKTRPSIATTRFFGTC